MSADAEGEQTTAETEQGNADDQLEIAQELQRESLSSERRRTRCPTR